MRVASWITKKKSSSRFEHKVTTMHKICLHFIDKGSLRISCSANLFLFVLWLYSNLFVRFAIQMKKAQFCIGAKTIYSSMSFVSPIDQRLFRMEWIETTFGQDNWESSKVSLQIFLHYNVLTSHWLFQRYPYNSIFISIQIH